MGSMRRYMQFVKPYKWDIVITFFFGIIKFMIPLATPIIIKIVIDDIIGAEKLSTEQKTTELFMWLGIMAVMFFILRPPIEYYRQYFGQRISNRILFDIRNKMYGHLQKLGLKFYANNRVGDVISRTINDVEQTKEFVVTGLMNVWIDLVTVFIAIGIMLYMDVELTLVTLVALPFYIISVKFFFTRLRTLTRERSKALAGVQSYLHERVQGMSVIKSFTLEKHEQAIFTKTNQNFLDKALDQTRWNAKTFMVVNTITGIAPVAVVGYAGYQVIHGNITVGTLALFIGYIDSLYNPLRRLVNSSTTLTQSVASMDRMFDLFDEEYDITDQKNAKDLPIVQGKVQFDDVVFRYDPEGRNILNHMSFTIEAGQTAAFVGMSGGGKSTIISLIPRFYDVLEGAIKIDGHDIRHTTIHSLRDQIGIVQQDNVLFSDSIKENIMMGNPRATDEEVIKAAKAANAHDFIMEFPEGYNTMVGERGVKLSGGQKQRVAIARVFLKNPPILILDEATSALDLESEALIQESLERLAHNRTTLIVAHRLSTITHADQIMLIDHGELKEVGTHQELMDRKRLYSDLFNVQVLN
ncbi:ABC transporter ATP-binding protein [Kurthia sibirica]|uniref:Multidrug ABC transporter ATP-binding protein n=1 Tax=Kurthia sibirica TaxID=202750 RepID=A0A2U3ALB4_9BACL|nr:ABC transporter ATP-binding protein [Kurthia sibirica]PWI25304.1 multidrug ABC transporter ATP-binding protein [Kurthia sibirica]GEK34632.1 putative multidrug export ATP-binding/permease protein YgaD [Kurthia sibirica]